jgi:hypothetical protein
MTEQARAIPRHRARDAEKTALSTIQIGMGSLTEQAGGLTRFYYDLVRHLPRSGVSVRGLVDDSGSSHDP